MRVLVGGMSFQQVLCELFEGGDAGAGKYIRVTNVHSCHACVLCVWRERARERESERERERMRERERKRESESERVGI